MERHFYSAEEAFLFYYDRINLEGVDHGNGTKALMNVGFYIDNPLINLISNKTRAWSKTYADREWEWYLSQNRSVEELKKYAPIWDKMHTGDNIVNSNYGWQWNRNDQLSKVILQLSEQGSKTRQAWVTIYDGKEKDDYVADTPCTLNIGFKIIGRSLCMNVLMRSNDLWYGFCNDQYCFSKLQISVLNALNYRSGFPEFRLGWYYHFASDLHLYNDKLGLEL